MHNRLDYSFSLLGSKYYDCDLLNLVINSL